MTSTSSIAILMGETLSGGRYLSCLQSRALEEFWKKWGLTGFCGGGVFGRVWVVAGRNMGSFGARFLVFLSANSPQLVRENLAEVYNFRSRSKFNFPTSANCGRYGAPA
jgi:hypothetical protein